MQVSKVQKAIAEGRRFLMAAELLVKTAKAEGNNELIFGSKLSGAVRRSSMDLTRALAEMRKP